MTMRRIFLALAFVLAFLPQAHAEDFTRAQIEQIIREYIANNPKEMIESVERYGKQQQQVEDEAASKLVRENMDWLVKNPKHAEAGNPKGDVTIVEFFDYNCGYCKAALPDLMTLLDADKNLRLVFVEIPILGDASTVAAKWALAARDQEKYLPFHISLMKHKGPMDEATYVDYATRAGLDVKKLKEAKDSNDVVLTIDDNLRMARTLSIQGTPAFIVGDQLIRGYVGIDALREAVQKARDKAK